ncbi:hypothetical protein J4416_04385 [Candidatus Pacearchaeota archaeon]|nr:hypothetical protein [Candidatus Pacearchaeota archaeon]
MQEKKSHGLNDQIASTSSYVPPGKVPGAVSEVSEELVAKNDKLKVELEDFKKKIVKKFPFTTFLSVLPAQAFKLFEEFDYACPRG